jgi:hypothetical protein
MSNILEFEHLNQQTRCINPNPNSEILIDQFFRTKLSPKIILSKLVQETSFKSSTASLSAKMNLSLKKHKTNPPSVNYKPVS